RKAAQRRHDRSDNTNPEFGPVFHQTARPKTATPSVNSMTPRPERAGMPRYHTSKKHNNRRLLAG
ncbi:MAG: hypothetical protein K8F25_17425, partial [Fimbriimonadaceae bacterium]|nr:hypothetical protein [Alphaproteobacteria bacterium]